MIIKNIIKSKTEPDSTQLWLRDGDLLAHINGSWEIVNKSTVQGVDNLEEQMSSVLDSVSKLNLDYIGLWDEFSKMKEIVISLQSGQLPALLAELGYTEEQVNEFVEANINMQLGITLDDVKNSVYVWKNKDYYIHLKLKGSSIPAMRVAPSWDQEIDKTGLAHEYTSKEYGTTSEIIDAERFLNMFAPWYMPILHVQTGGSFTPSGIPYFIGSINIDADIISLPPILKGCNNLVLTLSSSNHYSSTLGGNVKRATNVVLGSPQKPGYMPTLLRECDVKNLNVDNCYCISHLLEGAPGMYTLTSAPPLIGEWDFTKVIENAINLGEEYLADAPLNNIFSCREVKDSIVRIKSRDDYPIRKLSGELCSNDVLNGTYLLNTKVYLDYIETQEDSYHSLQQILGQPVSEGGSIREEDWGNNFYLNGLSRLIIDESDDYTAPNLTLFIPDVTYISSNINSRAGQSWWFKQIPDGLTTDIDINKFIDTNYFSASRFKDCIDSWASQSNPVNIIMDRFQYGKLNSVILASLTDKGYNIVTV